MSHWLDKLERKIGRYAIPNLMNYLIVLYVIGFAVFTVNPLFYVRYLSLDPAMILQGQVWRIITFVMVPPSTNLILCVYTSICLLYAWQTDGRDPRNVPV